MSSLSRISHLNIYEIWNVANVTQNAPLQHLCLKRIRNTYEQILTDPEFFRYTSLKGLQLLLDSEHLHPPLKVEVKILAVATWMASAVSNQEREIRERQFNGILEHFDLTALPGTFIADVALDNSKINLSENCKYVVLIYTLT